jgi:hypothetical protein
VDYQIIVETTTPVPTTRSKNKNNINKEIPAHFIPDKKSLITFPEKCMNAIGHV